MRKMQPASLLRLIPWKARSATTFHGAHKKAPQSPEGCPSISVALCTRSIANSSTPICHAKHKSFDRPAASAQRADAVLPYPTGVRRLSTRSGGLWGFLRGCKGGDPEPLPRPLKGLFPFVKGNSCTRSIANSSVPSPQPFYPESPTCEASLTFFTGEAFLTGLCQ